MRALLEAFAVFIHDHPDFTEKDTTHIAEHLQLLLDSDPEKIVLRQALEYYANEYNWPYETHSPDGLTITGMEVQEATEIAKQALSSSDQLKKEIMSLMLEGKSTDKLLKKKSKVG